MNEPVTLPDSSADLDERSAPAAPRLTRVLVVSPLEDAARLRRLWPRGPLFEAASSIDAALTRLGSRAWDAVVVASESLDRNELAMLARLCDARPRTPVLLLATRADDAAEVEAIRRGAQDVMYRGELTRERFERAIAWARERVLRLAELRELALTDPLTGLYNRRGFLLIAESHARMLRRTRRPSLLLYADLNGLKTINDRHGHAVGDGALVVVARALRVALRESDVIARYAGDEFVALVHDADGGAAATLEARIAAAVESLGREHGLPSPVSLSVGTTPFAAQSLTLEEMLLRADRALYAAKRDARGRPGASERPAA